MRYHFYVPDNLNIDDLLERQDFENIPGFSVDNLCFILNSIAERPSWYKDIVTEDGYIPLSGKMLQKWIGRDYKKYVMLLIHGGVIECDGHYTIGEKSKGYRFTHRYNGGIRRRLITDIGLIKKLNSYYTDYASDYTSLDKLTKKGTAVDAQFTSAINWYQSRLIKIDYGLAHSYNKAVYNYKIADRSLWDKEIKSGKVRLKNPAVQYRASHISIDKIHSGKFNQHADSNVYRLHSVITQCKRELRNAITIDGKEVVAVDISNSQPTLLAALIDPVFWDKKSSFNYTKIPYLNISSMFNTDAHLSTFIKMCKSAEHNSDKLDEVRRFRHLVASGIFYDTFRSLLEHKLGITGLNKQDVKTMFFTVLFTSNRFIQQPEAACKRVFKEWFPYIYELSSLLKVKSHASLPILLQRMESYIMFSRIIARIDREKPDMPFIPIHDSIAVPIGHESYTENVMREELTSCLGFAPHFKREHWRADTLTEAVDMYTGSAIAA